MPTRTQAVVIPEPGRVELRPVTVPDPGPHEILARTLVSGLSVGTERHYISGAYDRMGERPSETYPFATGYQRCAVVERTGEAVEGVRPGDRVLMRRSRLLDADIKGAAGHIGYGVADAGAVCALPPRADTEEAALRVMAGVGLHGARLNRVQAGEVVAVLGLGMVGQMAAQAARLRGARVLATDRAPRRVELAARWSADVARPGDLAAFVGATLEDHPDGVDVVVDTSSKVEVWDACRRLARREGRINLQGYYPGAFRIDSHDAHVRRLTVVFPAGFDEPADVARLLGERALAIAPLITHRFSVGQVREAYEVVMRAPREMVGGVIEWASA